MVHRDEAFANFVAAKRRRRQSVEERLKQLEALEEECSKLVADVASCPGGPTKRSSKNGEECASLGRRRRLVQTRLRTLEGADSPTAERSQHSHRRVRSMDLPEPAPEGTAQRRIRSMDSSWPEPSTPEAAPLTPPRGFFSATTSTASTRAGSLASTRASDDEHDLASLPEDSVVERLAPAPRHVVVDVPAPVRSSASIQWQSTSAWTLNQFVRPLPASRLLRSPAVFRSRA